MAMSVLVLLVLSAVPAQAGISVSAPSYTVGDNWSIKTTTGDTQVQVSNEVKKASVKVEGVDCTESEGINKVTTSGYTIESTATTWNRKSDLALVKIYTTSDIMGMKTEVTMTYNPPQKTYEFPLTVGKKWTSTSTVTTNTKTDIWGMTSETNTTDTETMHYEVLAEEKVTVAAGTFSTLKIKATDESGNYTYSWYSWKAGASVKIETEDGDVMELHSYKCANPGSATGGGGGGGGGDDDGDGAGGMFGDNMMFIIIILVVVIVIIVVVAVAMKKKSVATVPPPAQPQPQQTDPYGQQPPQQQYDPYGQQPPQQQYDPYGQQPPQQQYDPYGQQQQQQQYQQPPQY